MPAKKIMISGLKYLALKNKCESNSFEVPQFKLAFKIW